MTELEALRRVAEAAERVMATLTFPDSYPELKEALDALDALPAPAVSPQPTPNRPQALEALYAVVRDYDRGTGRGDLRWSDVRAAIAAVDDSPAPAAEPEGEVVEVAVWRDNDDGEVVFCIPKTERDGPLQGWTRLGTTRLALVPEVVGEVG